MKNIVVKDKIINITGINDEDYVSLTDIARIKNTDFPSDVDGIIGGPPCQSCC